MTSAIENQQHASMDASRSVQFTMAEIKEIIYQLNKSIDTMDTESSDNDADESGINNEKKVMLNQIIEKLQGNDKA